MAAGKEMPKRDTREVVPLNYTISLKKGDKVYTFSPFAAVIANAYAMSPKLLRRIFDKEQQYQRSNQPATPQARWEEQYIHEKNIADALREGIKGKYKSTWLFDASVGMIFQNISLTGNRLRGQLRSKSNENCPYNVILSDFFVGEDNRPHPRKIYCGCGYFTAKSDIGADDEYYFHDDPHTIVLRDEAIKQLTHPEWTRKVIMKKKDILAHRAPFNPYPFSTNWTKIKYKIGEGVYQAQDPLLVSIETAAMLRYFLGDSTHTRENQTLLACESVWTPTTREELKRGEIRFRIIRKSTKNGEISGSEEAELEMMESEAAKELARAGFKHRGYSISLGRIATRYERKYPAGTGTEVVEVIFANDAPPFYVRKHITGGNPDITLEDTPDSPFGKIKAVWFDDFTKTVAVDGKAGLLYQLQISGRPRFNIEISDGLRAKYRWFVPEKDHSAYGLA